MKSFDILHLLSRMLGWERFIALYYNFVYWWADRNGLSQFNYGYAPLSDAVAGDLSHKEPFQIELYRQVAVTLGHEALRGRRVLEISCGLGGGFAYLSRHF